MIYSEIKVSGIPEIEARLGSLKSKAPLALSRAINRAVTNVKKNMGKETAALYYVSSGDVKKTIRVVKATRASLKAAVISSGGPVELSKFKNARPLSWAVKVAESVPGRRQKIRRRETAGRKPEGIYREHEIRP